MSLAMPTDERGPPARVRAASRPSVRGAWSMEGGDLMKLKYIGAASALALGLAICGVAAAQPHDNSGPSATNNGYDGSATATNISIPGGNDNSIASKNNNSNQYNDYSQENGNSKFSGNTFGSGNTKMYESQNNNSNEGNDYSNNSGQDNSWHIDARVNVTDQNLSSSVSDVSFNGAPVVDSVGPDNTNGDDHHHRSEDNRRISTGNLSYSGGAFQGWAGIQTANNNTGVAANNLASTAVSANANVSFGGGNGGSQ
jgi:hypothetical protein